MPQSVPNHFFDGAYHPFCLICVCLCYYVRYTFLLKKGLQFLAVQRSFVVAVNRQRLTQYLETLHDCFVNVITIFILDRDYVTFFAENIYAN